MLNNFKLSANDWSQNQSESFLSFEEKRQLERKRMLRMQWLFISLFVLGYLISTIA